MGTNVNEELQKQLRTAREIKPKPPATFKLKGSWRKRRAFVERWKAMWQARALAPRPKKEEQDV